ncbi:hypothetical protein GRF59_14650 [Paenibacillus sp. HJL G12]|uniref:Uncharacterized protein n=1 Tax=Paenibacillus dendrobii TaxID=2691084 RepID=A0A7X3LIR6_9BACL|nr:hypothetical protein [Paenibacillus dendrobii]MWV44858.1 hypothetical protein [Paenibacillus dendrobii]
MARIESMSFSQFLNYSCEASKLKDVLISHLKRHKVVYRVVGVTIIIFASGIIDPTLYASGTGIDAGGLKIYHKLVNLGKWVIVIKGGWDTIQNTIKGDFDHAKKSFLQYLIIYIILLALPWSLDQIDSVFKSI